MEWIGPILSGVAIGLQILQTINGWKNRKGHGKHREE